MKLEVYAEKNGSSVGCFVVKKLGPSRFLVGSTGCQLWEV